MELYTTTEKLNLDFHFLSLSVCEFMLVRKVDNLGDNATIRTSGVCLSHTQPDLQYYFKQYQFNHPLCCCYSYKCLPKEI